jgi:hypothetical protein
METIVLTFVFGVNLGWVVEHGLEHRSVYAGFWTWREKKGEHSIIVGLFGKRRESRTDMSPACVVFLCREWSV